MFVSYIQNGMSPCVYLDLNETVICTNDQIEVIIPSAFFLSKVPPVYVSEKLSLSLSVSLSLGRTFWKISPGEQETDVTHPPVREHPPILSPAIHQTHTHTHARTHTHKKHLSPQTAEM